MFRPKKSNLNLLDDMLLAMHKCLSRCQRIAFIRIMCLLQKHDWNVTMSKASLFLVALLIASAGLAADWTQIFVHKNGVKWYASNAVQFDDGTIRVFLKVVRSKRESAPIAIILRCETEEVRDFEAGEFGSEFFKPWQPITPDSAGEIAFNAFCKGK